MRRFIFVLSLPVIDFFFVVFKSQLDVIVSSRACSKARTAALILVPRLKQSSCHTFFPGIMAFKDCDHVNVTTEDGSDPLIFTVAMLVPRERRQIAWL